MKKHGECTVFYIAYSLFGDAIFPVSVNAAKCKGLATGLDMIAECIVRKASIVSVVVLNTHYHFACLMFIHLLCFYGFLTRQRPLKMDVSEPAVLVNKNSTILVSTARELTLQLIIESFGRQN